MSTLRDDRDRIRKGSARRSGRFPIA
jgi:hypothetical protein